MWNWGLAARVVILIIYSRVISFLFGGPRVGLSSCWTDISKLGYSSDNPPLESLSKKWLEKLAVEESVDCLISDAGD